MSQKKSGCGCVPLLGLAVLATAGGTYLYLRGSFPWQQFTPLEAANIIPQEAIATSYVSTDPQAWSQLSQFGTPETQEVINNGLKEFKQNLATESINYDRDIQPWVGGISVAFLPVSSNGNPNLLIVIGIKDKLKALDFAKKLKKQPGYTLLESQYKGITITETTTSNRDYLASAIVGNYLLLGADRKIIEEAIDTSKGSPSYKNKPGVKQLLSRSLNLKQPLAQIYLDNYSEAVRQGLNLPQSASLPSETVDRLAKVQSVVAGVGIEDRGLHFQAITKIDPSILSQTPSTTSSKILSYLPSNTFAFFNTSNIRQGWTEIVQQSKNDPNLESFVREIRQSFRSASLDADTEVFGPMDREFALGIVATEQSSMMWGIGGMMVWETSARPTAERSLDKLNQVALNNLPNINITQTNLQGKNVTTWTSDQQTLLSYAWLNNNALAMTLWIPFQTIVDTKASNSVSQSANFVETIEALPQNNLGYVYIDLEQAMKDVPILNWGMTKDTKAVYDSLRGLAITATMPDKETSQIDAILSLKKEK